MTLDIKEMEEGEFYMGLFHHMIDGAGVIYKKKKLAIRLWSSGPMFFLFSLMSMLCLMSHAMPNLPKAIESFDEPVKVKCLIGQYSYDKKNGSKALVTTHIFTLDKVGDLDSKIKIELNDFSFLNDIHQLNPYILEMEYGIPTHISNYNKGILYIYVNHMYVGGFSVLGNEVVGPSINLNLENYPKPLIGRAKPKFSISVECH